MSDTIVGGWSPFRKPTEEDLRVFDEAMEGILGVKYTPEAVSTQVVAGMNYRFICKAQPVSHPIEYQATVQIYAPIDMKPYVTHITPH